MVGERPATTSASRLTIALLYSAIAASFLNLFLQLPLTPVLAHALSSDLMAVALAVSAYSIANLVGNLFAGLVVDRFPKVPVMAGGLLVGALALLAAGQVPAIGWLVGCLMLNGLGLSVVTPAAYAMLSEALPAGNRARGMASSGAFIGLAALIGPPLAGGMADKIGPGGAYAAAGGMLALVAIVVLAGLRRLEGAGEPDVGLGDLWAMLKSRPLWPAFAGAFGLMFANGSLVFALPPQVKAMGYSHALIGALFSVFAVFAIAVFLSPLGKLSYRAGRPVMAVGAAIIAASMFALSFAPGLLPKAAALSTYGVGFGLLFPAAMSLLVENAPEDRRGTAFGLFYALFSLGAVAGPMVLARLSPLGLPPFMIAACGPALLALLVWVWRPMGRPSRA